MSEPAAEGAPDPAKLVSDLSRAHIAARCLHVIAEAGIADDQVIQTCIAMGWPDDAFPANAVVSHRKPIDDAVVFVGFDG